MSPRKVRCIVERENLVEELKRCEVSARKLDDVMGGLDNTICTSPEVFSREEVTGWSRIMVKSLYPDIPAMRIWFTYDDDRVYIERVDLLSEYL